MTRTWKLALGGGALALAGAAAAGLRAVTNLFIDEAMNREESPALKNLMARAAAAGRKKRDPLLADLPAAQERLRASETERIEITAPDGTALVGHWRPCAGRRSPERVIIAMHGWRSRWYTDFAGIADFWRDHGCAVLFAEQRAQGESGGNYMGFGLLEQRDCLAWVQWANAHGAARLPVYLAGISMGATTVLMAAGLDLPGNVRGVMADCGFTSPDAIWRFVARRSFHLPYALVRPRVARLCREKLHFEPDADSTLNAMRRTRLPVLFVHGTEDGFVPPSMSEENYAACAAAGKRLLLVPGAAHGMSYLAAPAQYQATVLSFWRETEGAAGAR